MSLTLNSLFISNRFFVSTKIGKNFDVYKYFSYICSVKY
nr:MAG TPA: hypothetical protein [Crassvirales sp.]